MSRSFIMKKLVSPTAVRSKEMPLKFRPGKLFLRQTQRVEHKVFKRWFAGGGQLPERPSAWGNDFLFGGWYHSFRHELQRGSTCCRLYKLKTGTLTLPRFDKFTRGSSHPLSSVLHRPRHQWPRAKEIENTSFSHFARKANLSVVVFDEKLGVVQSEART